MPGYDVMAMAQVFVFGGCGSGELRVRSYGAMAFRSLLRYGGHCKSVWAAGSDTW